MFDTHDILHHAHIALMASMPQLDVRSNCNATECGLEFVEQHPRVHNAPVSGSFTIQASGAIIVRTDGYTGPRWHSALDRLATAAPTGWKWRPSTDRKPGQLDGVLHLEPNVTAETTITPSRSRHADNARAGLTLIPGSSEACTAAWSLAVTALAVVVTDDPTYNSPVIASPTPAARCACAGIPAAPAPDGSPLDSASFEVGQILRTLAPEATSALVDLAHHATVCAVFAGENEIDTADDTGPFDTETLGNADAVLRTALDEASAGAFARSDWEHVADERTAALYRITFPVALPAS